MNSIFVLWFSLHLDAYGAIKKVRKSCENIIFLWLSLYLGAQWPSKRKENHMKTKFFLYFPWIWEPGDQKRTNIIWKIDFHIFSLDLGARGLSKRNWIWARGGHPKGNIIIWETYFSYIFICFGCRGQSKRKESHMKTYVFLIFSLDLGARGHRK